MNSIRTYIEGDADEICAVFEASVRAIAPAHYSKEQTQAWIANAPTKQHVESRCTDGRTTFVSLSTDARIIAYIDLEADGHIDHLYCAPEASRKGVSLKLYELVEELALEQKIAVLHTEASEAAKRFFTRRGFHVTSRQDLKIGDVEIHNFAMRKVLG